MVITNLNLRFSLATSMIFLMFFNLSHSQDDQKQLKFDISYLKAVDNWVAFPNKDADSTFTYGFIYLDNQAGFTFDFSGKFKVDENQFVAIKKQDSAFVSMKYRLGPDTINVHVLSDSQRSSLNLPIQPDWLSIYKADSDQVSYLKNEGYHFNHAGASELALEPLLKAYEKDPHYDGLEFELAYAYNHLGEYNKAIQVLERAIDHDPNNFYFYRELGYSYININQIQEAEQTYRKGIAMSNNDFEKSEMAVNMAQAFFNLKNKEKFEEWAKKTKEFADENSQYNKYIDYFEQNWNQQ